MIFVLDVDGILTSGNFFYSREGKVLKEFGADDFDALREIMNFIPVVFISADIKGLPIHYKRIVEEMKWDFFTVSGEPKIRWDWMKKSFPNKKIIYMGDGIYDWYSLESCFFGITTKDALEHVKDVADFVTKRSGGNRAAAEACIHLMERFNFDWKKKYV